MDVCLAAPRFYPVYSGPGMRFQRYEPGLRERGIAMRVLAEEAVGAEDTGGARAADPSPGNVRLEHVEGIPVHRVALPSGGPARDQWEYARALAKYCRAPGRRPDVIQLLGIPLPTVPWLVQLRRQRIPLVFTHTMGGELSGNRWKRMLQRIYWPIPFQLMDCIVVSSGVMEANLREIGVTRRVEVIPNGVDLERFHPVASKQEKAGLRERLGFSPESELVVFIGTLNERKGIHILLEAWARIAHDRPRARLVLVGPRHSELGFAPTHEIAFEEKLKAIIAREELADRVVFTGAVNRVEDYLRLADVFILPSRREGMPNVVPEAFATGVATVVTPFVGLPGEFGRAGEQYVLADRTPEGVAAALRSLLEDPARRRATGEAGLRWVRDHLDVNQSLDQYAALYRELAGTRIKPRSE